MEIRLLGPLEVVADGAVVPVRGRKERAILTLLALRVNQTVSAEVLIDLLWADEPPGDPENALRTYVSRLRGALGHSSGQGVVVEAVRNGFRLTGDGLSVDWQQAERLAASAADAAANGDLEAARQDYVAALALWRGDPGRELGDNPRSRAQTVRFREMREHLQEELIETELCCGRHHGAVAALEAMVAAEPMRERRWGQLMLALYRSGRQAEALRAFQRLRRVLAESLGVEPNAQVVALEEAMILQKPELDWCRANEAAASAGASVRSGDSLDAGGRQDRRGVRVEVPAVALPSILADVDGGSLVGREEELAQLRHLWGAASSGNRRVALVGGEAGIGKTRIVSDFARAVYAEGAVVLYGRCDEEFSVAYQPFREAFRHYVNSASDSTLRLVSRRFVSDLALLVPEVAERLGMVVEPVVAEPQVERYRLFQAVDAFIAAAAGEAPIVLVLDDVHWADRGSLALIRHLLHCADPARLLLVATYRDTDVEGAHPLMSLMADLVRIPGAERILLRGLSASAVAELIDQLGAARGSTATVLVGVVAEETGGNPLFIRELVRHLVDSKNQRSDDSADQASDWPAKLTVPRSVKDVIGWRVSRLSPSARRLLEAAAVIGVRFNADDLAGITDAGEDVLIDGLEAATGAGLVRESAGDVGWYAFSHGLTRDCLYESMSGLRRASFNRAAGAYLAALPDGRRDQRAGEIAHHFFEAGSDLDVARAVVFAQLAAKAAFQQRAFEDAVVHLERASRIATGGVVADDVRCAVLLSLGEARWAVGAEGEARRAFEEAVILARTLRDPSLLAAAAVGMAGPDYKGGSRDDELAAVLEEAITAVGPSPSALRIRALAALGRVLRWTGDSERVQALTAEAVATARVVGDPAALAVACSADFLAHMGTAPQRCADVAQELIIAARGCGDLSAQAEGHIHGLFSCLEMCDRTGAERELTALRHFAAETRQPLYRWYSLSWDATFAVMEGRFGDGQRLADEAVNLGFAVRGIDATFAHVAQVSPIRWAQGRIGELLVGDRYQDIYPALRSWDTARPWILAVAGRTDDAAAELERVVESGLGRFAGTFDAPVTSYAFLSHACINLGARRHASALYERLVAYRDYQVVIPTWLAGGVVSGAVSYYLGGLAALMGRWDDAVGHFELACDQHRMLGARPWLGWTYLRYGLASQSEGDGDRAADLLGRAEAIAAEVGMPRLQVEVAAATPPREL